MVQIPPTHYHTLKSHPSMSRFGSLPSRHTPTSQDLARSHTKHTNAVERVALRKFMSQVLTSHSSFPKPQSTAVTPVSTCSVSSLPSSTSSLDSSALSTPPTPSTSLEVDQDSLPEIKPKAGIFGNTTKSDELLDLILSALYRIYIEDFSQESDSYQSKPTMQPGIDVLSEAGAYKDNCDHCPDLIDGSSVSSGSSTPDSIPTPPPMSPEFNPEIACSTREGTPNYPTASCTATTVKAKMQSVGRTQSLPNNYQYQAQTAAPRPVLEDKSLRWFVTELLRRSRASASVVQLALYYLKQARGPVGKLLNQKFKSARVSGEDGAGSEGDSPLVDPRKLVLAAIMLSTKILHDHAPNSRAWSRVCGLEPRQVSACESALGRALNWELVHMIVGPRDESVLFE